jgi:hypothetical protein
MAPPKLKNAPPKIPPRPSKFKVPDVPDIGNTTKFTKEVAETTGDMGRKVMNNANDVGDEVGQQVAKLGRTAGDIMDDGMKFLKLAATGVAFGVLVATLLGEDSFLDNLANAVGKSGAAAGKAAGSAGGAFLGGIFGDIWPYVLGGVALIFVLMIFSLFNGGSRGGVRSINTGNIYVYPLMLGVLVIAFIYLNEIALELEEVLHS